MNLSSINLRFFANIAPLVGGLNKAERALDNTGKKFESIGRSLTKSISLPMAAIGTLSVSVFSAFEQQMAEVKAVSGATADEFQKLKKNAEDLGASTIFSAKEVGQLQAEFAKLGFSASEITKVTEATLYLAQASGEDLARSAEIAGSTLRAFGLDASQTTHVADVMAQSFNKSALDLSTFADSMKYVGPVAASAGISLEETSAMLAVLSNAGIKGSMAGTALRKIIGDLAGGTQPLADKLKQLSAQGISFSDANEEVGRTAQSALLVLTKGAAQIDPLTQSFKNADGAAKQMAMIMGDTLQGSMKELESASEGAMIQIGEMISMAFKPLVQMASSALTAFNEMNPTIKKMIVGFALAVSAVGPAILAIGGLVRTFAMLKAVMLAANPVLMAAGLAIGVIGSAMMVQSSAMQDASGELIRHRTEANALIAVINDENTSQEVRNSLIEKFNAKFGSYIGNIDKEKASVEQLAKFQKQFNDELAQKIKIAGMEKVLTREMEKAAQIQADLIDLEVRRVDYQTKLQKIQAQNDPARTADLELNLMRNIDAVTESIARKTNEAQGLERGISSLTGQMEKLNPTLATTSSTMDEVAKSTTDAEEEAKAAEKRFAEMFKELDKLEEMQAQLKRADIGEFWRLFDEQLQFLPTIERVDMEDLVDPEVFTELPKNFVKLSLAAQDMNQKIAQAIESAAERFAVGIGEMIGSAIAGGEGFKNFGSFLLETLAGLLYQVGEMAIGVGIAIDSIKNALKTLGGAGAIAAGIALIAIASGIRTSMAAKANKMGGGNIPMLAEGGIATGPTLAMIGEGRGPEAVIPLDKLEGMMGGFGGQNIVVTGRLQGADLLISNERATRERSRYRGF